MFGKILNKSLFMMLITRTRNWQQLGHLRSKATNSKRENQNDKTMLCDFKGGSFPQSVTTLTSLATKYITTNKISCFQFVMLPHITSLALQ